MIRPLDEADVESLAVALSALPLLTRYRRGAAALAADLRAALVADERIVIHDDGSGPEGLAWFTLTGTFGALGGYLRLLAVIPGAHGRGVGTALLESFERSVANTSRHAFLLVSDFNLGAQRFYERHGYRRVGAIPGAVLPDVTEVIYHKRLR